MPKKQAAVPGISVVERVILYVRDVGRSARWYSEVLGLSVRYEDKTWAEFDTKGVGLCLHAGRKTGRVPELNAVSFRVEDFDAAYRALMLHEVSELTEPFSPGPELRCASFGDPDGNIIGIEGR
jgi:predicted enzyme related to lactoylglutathione lyase